MVPAKASSLVSVIFETDNHRNPHSYGLSICTEEMYCKLATKLLLPHPWPAYNIFLFVL
jgi:hypothetical protein